MLKVVRKILAVSAPLALLMGGGLATADSTVDYNVNIAPSLNVDLSSSNVVLNLNPNSKTFGYQDVDVTVSTNYEAGYVLSMSTADSSTDLKRDNTVDGVNASINTLGSSYTDANFSSCTSSDTNCMNKWGYKNGLSSANYLPFSSPATPILSNTTATNEDSTTLRFAAKIDYDLPAGTYNNELIFTATANPIVYNINYYNGYDTTSAGIIATQQNTSGSVSSITLSPGLTPSRSTYTFAGWCIDNTNRINVSVNTNILFDSTNKIYSNPGTVCNGTMYQTGDYLALSPNDTNNINIYAMWTPTTFDQAYVAANKTKDTSGYYMMQDMSASICNAVSENQITTLTDTRINSSYTSRNNYTIIKLPNGGTGKCWMADNIALDLTNSTVLNSISTTNTNVDAASLTSLKSGNRSANARYATAGIASSWGSTDSYTQPMMKKDGMNCDASINSTYACSPNGGTGYTYNSVALNSSDYGIGFNKLGIFYNYCAASAGNYCYDSNQTTTNNADYDICPANWKLPTDYTSSGDFYELTVAIPNQTGSSPFSLQYRLSLPLSGYYQIGSAWYQGVFGYSWSVTYGSVGMMNRLGLNKGGAWPGGRGHRVQGFPVRCIAQN